MLGTNILAGLIGKIWNVIMRAILGLWFMILYAIAWVLDMLTQLFFIFSGMTPVSNSTADTITGEYEKIDIVNFFLTQKTFQKAYLYLCFVALGLIIVFTIGKIIKQDYFDRAGPRSKAPIFRNVALSFIAFICIIPVFYFLIDIAASLALLVMKALGYRGGGIGTMLFGISWSDGGVGFQAVGAKLYSGNPSPDNFGWYPIDTFYQYYWDEGAAKRVEIGYQNMHGLERAQFYWYVFIFTGLILIVNLGKMMVAMVTRMFKLISLFIVAPSPISQIVLDDGAKFKQWKDKVIQEALKVVGCVMSFMIFMLIAAAVPELDLMRYAYTPDAASAYDLLESNSLTSQLSSGVEFMYIHGETAGWADKAINALGKAMILIAGVGAIQDIDSTITPFISGGNSSMDGGATGKAIGAAGSAAVKGAVGITRTAVSGAVGAVTAIGTGIAKGVNAKRSLKNRQDASDAAAKIKNGETTKETGDGGNDSKKLDGTDTEKAITPETATDLENPNSEENAKDSSNNDKEQNKENSKSDDGLLPTLDQHKGNKNGSVAPKMRKKHPLLGGAIYGTLHTLGGVVGTAALAGLKVAGIAAKSVLTATGMGGVANTATDLVGGTIGDSIGAVKDKVKSVKDHKNKLKKDEENHDKAIEKAKAKAAEEAKKGDTTKKLTKEEKKAISNPSNMISKDVKDLDNEDDSVVGVATERINESAETLSSDVDNIIGKQEEIMGADSVDDDLREHGTVESRKSKRRALEEIQKQGDKVVKKAQAEEASAKNNAENVDKFVGERNAQRKEVSEGLSKDGDTKKTVLERVLGKSKSGGKMTTERKQGLAQLYKKKKLMEAVDKYKTANRGNENTQEYKTKMDEFDNAYRYISGEYSEGEQSYKKIEKQVMGDMTDQKLDKLFSEGSSDKLREARSAVGFDFTNNDDLVGVVRGQMAVESKYEEEMQGRAQQKLETAKSHTQEVTDHVDGIVSGARSKYSYSTRDEYEDTKAEFAELSKSTKPEDKAKKVEVGKKLADLAGKITTKSMKAYADTKKTSGENAELNDSYRKYQETKKELDDTIGEMRKNGASATDIVAAEKKSAELDREFSEKKQGRKKIGKSTIKITRKSAKSYAKKGDSKGNIAATRSGLGLSSSGIVDAEVQIEEETPETPTYTSVADINKDINSATDLDAREKIVVKLRQAAEAGDMDEGMAKAYEAYGSGDNKAFKTHAGDLATAVPKNLFMGNPQLNEALDRIKNVPKTKEWEGKSLDDYRDGISQKYEAECKNYKDNIEAMKGHLRNFESDPHAATNHLNLAKECFMNAIRSNVSIESIKAEIEGKK